MENNLKDIQSQKDSRGIAIQRVGISDLHYPIKLKSDSGKIIHSVATIEASVDLPAEQKGTHMSRFVEVISKQEIFDYSGIKSILSDMKKTLHSKNAYIHMDYIQFIEKFAPVSDIISQNDINVGINASLNEDDIYDFVLNLQIPVTSLCPCSKEISTYGAHNQRCYITVGLNLKCEVVVENLVSTIESCGSSAIYSLLKRPDEKYVTEQAYENPKFVEDISREVALKLNELDSIHSYEIRVDSVESIHNHLAFSYIIKENI